MICVLSWVVLCSRSPSLRTFNASPDESSALRICLLRDSVPGIVTLIRPSLQVRLERVGQITCVGQITSSNIPRRRFAARFVRVGRPHAIEASSRRRPRPCTDPRFSPWSGPSLQAFSFAAAGGASPLAVSSATHKDQVLLFDAWTYIVIHTGSQVRTLHRTHVKIMYRTQIKTYPALPAPPRPNPPPSGPSTRPSFCPRPGPAPHLPPRPSPTPPSQLGAWIDAGFLRHPDHDAFRSLLAAPQAECLALCRDPRRPVVPKIIECRQGSSLARFLLARLDVEGGLAPPASAAAGRWGRAGRAAPGRLFSDDADLGAFAARLAALAVA